MVGVEYMNIVYIILFLQSKKFFWFAGFYSFYQLYKKKAPRFWFCDSKACIEISGAEF